MLEGENWMYELLANKDCPGAMSLMIGGKLEVYSKVTEVGTVTSKWETDIKLVWLITESL